MPLFETLASFAVTRSFGASEGIQTGSQSSAGVITNARFVSCFGIWEKTGNVITTYKTPDRKVGPQTKCEWVKGGCLGFGKRETTWTQSPDTNINNCPRPVDKKR